MQVSSTATRILHGVWLQRVLRIVLGVFFIYVGYAKLDHADKVAQNLLMLDLLPWSTINCFAVWMICFEMVIGILLITGVWLRACSTLVMGFCVVCLGLIWYAIASGLTLHCGCFVTAPTGAARTWASLWQEGGILVACVWLWTTTGNRLKEERTETE